MKETLHHYIIVRRDIPLGVAMAMVAHVAFANGFHCRGSSEKEHPALGRGVGGLSPSHGSNSPAHLTMGVASNGEDALKAAGRAILPEPIVVVLGARNERKLWRLMTELNAAKVGYAGFVEEDEPYGGQLMAVGLQPGHKDHLLQHVEEFQLLRV